MTSTATTVSPTTKGDTTAGGLTPPPRKTKVYRVEHPTRGHGPYNGHSGSRAEVALVDELTMIPSGRYSTHPHPAEDGIGWHWTTRHHCGFESIEQARDWFAPFTDLLRDADYMLGVYEIEDEHECPEAGDNWWDEGCRKCPVKRGERQVMFLRDEATLLHHIDVTAVMRADV